MGSEGQITLDICILTISDRRQVFDLLHVELMRQIGDRTDVRVIWLGDNSRPGNWMFKTGTKRQIIHAATTARYCTWLDDDDWIAPDYIESIMDAIANHDGVDVIVFDQLCQINDEQKPTRVGLEYIGKGDTAGTQYRGPWLWCVWKGSLFRAVRFQDIRMIEDSEWCRYAWMLAKTQHRIEKTLHFYCYQHQRTAGSTY